MVTPNTVEQHRYRRWVAVFAVFIVVMFQMGIFKTLGVFVPQFKEDFDLSAGAVGLMFSIAAGFTFLLGPLWGALAQVFGYRPITIVGGVLTGSAMICLHWSINLSHLTLSMALLSIGVGLPSVAIVMILNDYFKEEMSMANGLAFTGAAIGMIIFPPFAEYLIEKYGWRAAFLLLGAVCFNMCVAGVLMKPPSSRHKHVSQDITISPYRCRNFATFKDALKSYLSCSVLAKVPILATYLAAFSLWSLATAGWVIFLVTYTITLGYSPQTASFLSSIGGAGTLIGRLMTGPIMDSGYTSGRTLFCILSAGGSASLVLYPFVESYWALTVVSFLVGLFVGTPKPVVILMLKELLPDDDDTEAFTGAVGLHYFSVGVGLLSGGPLTGLMYDMSGTFYLSFIALSLVELLAALLPCVNLQCSPHDNHDSEEQLNLINPEDIAS